MAAMTVYEDLQYPPFIYEAAGEALILSPKSDDGEFFYDHMNKLDVLGYQLTLDGTDDAVYRSQEFCRHLQQVTTQKGTRAYAIIMKASAKAIFNKGKKHGRKTSNP